MSVSSAKGVSPGEPSAQSLSQALHTAITSSSIANNVVNDLDTAVDSSSSSSSSIVDDFILPSQKKRSPQTWPALEKLSEAKPNLPGLWDLASEGDLAPAQPSTTLGESD